MANRRFSIQIYVGTFDSKAISTVSNITVNCTHVNFTEFLKSLQLALRLKPADPLHEILQVKIKFDGKYKLVDTENFNNTLSKIVSLGCKHFAKVLVTPPVVTQYHKQPVPQPTEEAIGGCRDNSHRRSDRVRGAESMTTQAGSVGAETLRRRRNSVQSTAVSSNQASVVPPNRRSSVSGSTFVCQRRSPRGGISTVSASTQLRPSSLNSSSRGNPSSDEVAGLSDRGRVGKGSTVKGTRRHSIMSCTLPGLAEGGVKGEGGETEREPNVTTPLRPPKIYRGGKNNYPIDLLGGAKSSFAGNTDASLEVVLPGAAEGSYPQEVGCYAPGTGGDPSSHRDVSGNKRGRQGSDTKDEEREVSIAVQRSPARNISNKDNDDGCNTGGPAKPLSAVHDVGGECNYDTDDDDDGTRIAKRARAGD